MASLPCWSDEMTANGIPRATVRLQFHAGFTFADALAVVDYYADLGISHLYASPLLSARKGSMHGYDIVDPTRVNPELGGEAGLRALVAKLRSRDMGLIMDIVPNHMGVGGSENPWWLHVLEWGPHSRYARWFDIDWDSPDLALQGKILLPFLGQLYAEALQAGELQPSFDDENGSIYIRYHEHRFPLCSSSYALVLTDCPPILQPVSALFSALQSALSDTTVDSEQAHVAACSMLRDIAQSPEGKEAIDTVLSRLLPRGQLTSTELLHQLLEQQYYRLTWWRNAAEEINWRRFFEISDLAGIRVEEEDVFEATHAHIFRLYAEGLVDGVRIDHVDGLANPGAYCRRLRQRLESINRERPEALRFRPYIVVEKILAHDEGLCTDWDIDGTTGYDFMNQVGALLHDPQGEAPLSWLWQELAGDDDDFIAHVHLARRQILNENLVGEFTALANAFHALARCDLVTRDIPFAAIRRVLTELLVAFPVYRGYVSGTACGDADRRALDLARTGALSNVRAADLPLLETLVRWLRGEDSGGQISIAGGAVSEPLSDEAKLLQHKAITRFQQVTPPLAAKSMEDTAFYRYGVLMSHNEVGADPSVFSISIAEFHRLNLMRLKAFPHALLATATHDHKRGEDARMRLAVLSELAEDWAASVRRWKQAHEPLLAKLEPEASAESANMTADMQWVPQAPDELMLYQTIVSAWPEDMLDADHLDRARLQTFAERISAWQEKALREAKHHSSWTLPNQHYEAICREFVFHLLNPDSNLDFLSDIVDWICRITPAANANSLVQTLLRLTSPGVPDLYQGTEFWDFSLVDPDNRRPVEYSDRRAAFGTVSLDTRWTQRPTPQMKQALIHGVLAFRRACPALFESGDYLPLEVSGPHAENLLAFARRHRDGDTEDALIVATTILRGRELAEAGFSTLDWWGTDIVLPEGFEGVWDSVFDGQTRSCERMERIVLPARMLLDGMPLALLRRRRNQERFP
ncbi:MAG TPA: malto-oligosyltrehalose synthase [Rhodocyclaceae bacterium]|nr:malto-oligosyltrehalose synthase [Rhodocyclaceae bacterium]